MENVQIIGIAGGSGSGKTFLAKQIMKCVGEQRAVLIQQDSYYKDLSGYSPEEINDVNFDHPNALDAELLVEQLTSLKNNKEVNRPIYDFSTHTRKKEHSLVQPRSIIIVEGIFILSIKEIRELLDISLFIDASADVRFIKRLQRDLAERGREVSSVIQQYQTHVRPMHLEFVEPNKKHAHIRVSGDNGLEDMAVIAKKLTTCFTWNFS